MFTRKTCCLPMTSCICILGRPCCPLMRRKNGGLPFSCGRRHADRKRAAYRRSGGCGLGLIAPGNAIEYRFVMRIGNFALQLTQNPGEEAAMTHDMQLPKFDSDNWVKVARFVVACHRMHRLVQSIGRRNRRSYVARSELALDVGSLPPAICQEIDCDPEQMLGDKGYDSQPSAATLRSAVAF
jgi:hypothetical protein